MNGDPWFVDTNVLVYLFDVDSPSKQARAKQVLDDNIESIVLSTQVLGEFYVTVTRKLKKPLPTDRAMDAVNNLRAFPIRPVHTGLVLSAVRRSQSSHLSYWDALIVESALEAGAEVLVTEDLQHGQTFAGLRVFNPFREDATATAQEFTP